MDQDCGGGKGGIETLASPHAIFGRLNAGGHTECYLSCWEDARYVCMGK